MINNKKNFNQIIKLILFFLIIISISRSTLAATYYVSTTGSDSSTTGNFTNPFRTVQHGIDALSTPGDVLYIRGGTYTENVYRRASLPINGNPSNKIIVSGYPGETAIIDGNHAGNTFYVFASYFVLENLTIINGYPFSILFYDTSHDLRLNNLEVYGTGGPTDGGSSQIYFFFPNNVIVENSKVHDSVFVGVGEYTNAGGIGLDSIDYLTGTKNITIRNNQVYNMPLGVALWTKHPSLEASVEYYNNTIYNVYVAALIRNPNAYFHHNIIYNVTGEYAMRIFDENHLPNGWNNLNNVTVEYNTIAVSNYPAILYVYGNNVTIKNNIYYEINPSSGGVIRMCAHSGNCFDGSEIQNVYSNNNCVYNSNSNIPYLTYHSSTYTLQQAQSVLGIDLNSIFNNPQFISTTIMNPNFLRPAVGNACEGMGYYANGAAPQNQTICTEPYNYYRCDCINSTELSNTINGWNTGQININQLITNIKIWKTCST